MVTDCGRIKVTGQGHRLRTNSQTLPVKVNLGTQVMMLIRGQSEVKVITG